MGENKLRTLEEVIKPILETQPKTRGDNFELVLRVYEEHLSYSNYMTTMSFRELLENHNNLGLPSFESITRVRRKLQRDFPELQPDKETQMVRMKETETYIEYAFDI